MASLKSIRKRISSVKSTQKITRAMKMVAGARLNRAQQRIVALRPYAVKTREVLEAVADAVTTKHEDDATSSVTDVKPLHPLLARRVEKKAIYLVLSGDRGLAGAFNANVNKASERAWREKRELGVAVSFVTVGRKGREYLARRGGEIAHDFPRMYEGLDLEKVTQISSYLVGKFKSGEVDAIYIVYNEFVSPITQRPRVESLLPLSPPPVDKALTSGDAKAQFIYEPAPEALLDRLVPMYVDISIYRALLETQAGFYGAQMSAMDAATRNAKEMIARLTLLYNRARQAAITKELMEIIGGAEALKE
jgi:F-type H+-transporting ATPase subunit gamma